MFEKIISKIGSCLNKHKIPYMIIGGQAVLLYGEPRLTRDIEDVNSIVLKNPSIDLTYIRTQLKEFDLSLENKNFLKTFEEILKNR